MDKHLKRFLKKPITGVIHIGSHNLEDRETYRDMTDAPIVWFEANTFKADFTQDFLEGSDVLINSGIWKGNRAHQYYLTEDDQFGSLREPIHHIVQQEYRIYTQKLDFYQNKFFGDTYNHLVLKVNGAEIPVLEGAVHTLKHIDSIYLRFYRGEYKNEPTLKDIDSFFSRRKFRRAYTKILPSKRGEVLMVRTP